MIATARAQLAPYDYGVTDAGQITRNGRGLGVYVSRKGPRTHARTADGRLLWSGADLGAFAEWFWYAKRTTTPTTTSGASDEN